MAGTLLPFAAGTCGKSIDIILRSYIFRKPITYWTGGFKFGHCVVESFAYSRPTLLVGQFDLTVRDIDLGAAIKLDCCPAQPIFAEMDLDVGIGRLTDQSASPSVHQPCGPRSRVSDRQAIDKEHEKMTITIVAIATPFVVPERERIRPARMNASFIRDANTEDFV